MEYEGFKLLLCDNDADRAVVKEVIDSYRESVNVVADDTDILCLLLPQTTYLLT